MQIFDITASPEGRGCFIVFFTNEESGTLTILYLISYMTRKGDSDCHFRGPGQLRHEVCYWLSQDQYTKVNLLSVYLPKGRFFT